LNRKKKRLAAASRMSAKIESGGQGRPQMGRVRVSEQSVKLCRSGLADMAAQRIPRFRHAQRTRGPYRRGAAPNSQNGVSFGLKARLHRRLYSVSSSTTIRPLSLPLSRSPLRAISGVRARHCRAHITPAVTPPGLPEWHRSTPMSLAIARRWTGTATGSPASLVEAFEATSTGVPSPTKSLLSTATAAPVRGPEGPAVALR
jgi:hypothetical protein